MDHHFPRFSRSQYVPIDMPRMWCFPWNQFDQFDQPRGPRRTTPLLHIGVVFWIATSEAEEFRVINKMLLLRMLPYVCSIFFLIWFYVFFLHRMILSEVCFSWFAWFYSGMVWCFFRNKIQMFFVKKMVTLHNPKTEILDIQGYPWDHKMTRQTVELSVDGNGTRWAVTVGLWTRYPL